jgi:hypothetical protein
VPWPHEELVLTQASGRVTHARHVEQQEPGKRQLLSVKMGVRHATNNLTSVAKFLKIYHTSMHFAEPFYPKTAKGFIIYIIIIIVV